ncbi:MAG: glycosyltransferase family 39 protein [Chryseobacterium sp.]|jgi:hypothetical protein|uniref:hypothetical protein n=1 Tax=Chryseobacterium sp. TaxID=1871047 RepID=UPI00282EC739|nr:hypothetical protein [Chryseobacterium sp.]MDR2237946.1 glycosyltransferase family 39 protein [Chryseobacterium sp.]
MPDFSKTRWVDFFLNWKTFLILNLLILSLKIIFSVYQHFNVDFFEDWAIAENLARDGVYSMQSKFGSSAYKLPVYPLFLTFFIKAFGAVAAVKWIVIIQHLFYFIIPVIIIKILGNFQLQKAGFLSAYFFIFSPAYFYYSNVLEATNIFILFLAIWFYLYSLLWTSLATAGKLTAFAVMTALVALTQVVAVPIMVVMILLLVFYKKISVKHILAVGGLAAILYAPWVIRNYLTFDKVIISKSPVWQNVFLGYGSAYQILPGNQFMTEKEEKEVEARIAVNNEFDDELIFEEEVSKIVEKDTMAPFKKGLNNFISLWFVPKRYFDNNGLSVLVGRKLYVLGINILLLISLGYFFRKNKPFFLFLCVLFAGFTFPYLIGHAANIRFKLDFEWIETSVIALFLFLKYLKPKNEGTV